MLLFSTILFFTRTRGGHLVLLFFWYHKNLSPFFPKWHHNFLLFWTLEAVQQDLLPYSLHGNYEGFSWNSPEWFAYSATWPTKHSSSITSIHFARVCKGLHLKPQGWKQMFHNSWAWLIAALGMQLSMVQSSSRLAPGGYVCMQLCAGFSFGDINNMALAISTDWCHQKWR